MLAGALARAEACGVNLRAAACRPVGEAGQPGQAGRCTCGAELRGGAGPCSGGLEGTSWPLHCPPPLPGVPREKQAMCRICSESSHCPPRPALPAWPSKTEGRRVGPQIPALK